jgi:hypothetical protein
MRDPVAAKPPQGTWIERNVLRLLAAFFLLVIALTPDMISMAFALGDAVLLWVLLSIPLAKAMAGTSTGSERVLFGGMAVLLGALGAALLVGLACIRPLSKLNL